MNKHSGRKPEAHTKVDRLKMEGVAPEDALAAFMKVDPERVKETEEAAKKERKEK